ncbi:MAG TPA: SDR family NAD(P)-dependent oxidoreductase [Bacteroidales bacterium]|nr:SDR family NAD(P)-dependent oxidoreductase [Bacteroidales bacterium]HQB23234.1 SDR family NAD(P)-dependent oxidoreductase [Bacteroidales bacterium]
MNSSDFPVALVTGANGGIGKVICKELLSSGYRVILSFRKSERAVAFYNSLLQEYGAERIGCLEMDLSSVTSITEAVCVLMEKEQRLDVLVNNAGMLGYNMQVSAEGYEMHNMVNCLGPMLFTRMVKPLLQEGSRVVTTVSLALYYGSIPDNFPYPHARFNRFRQYACSKLALTLLCLRLAELWKEEGITVNMADPGIVDTPILKLHKWIDPVADVLFRPLIRTPEQGAATSLYLATHADLEGVTGGIYKDMTVRNLPERVRSYPQAENVWRFFLYLHSKQ